MQGLVSPWSGSVFAFAPSGARPSDGARGDTERMFRKYAPGTGRAKPRRGDGAGRGAGGPASVGGSSCLAEPGVMSERPPIIIIIIMAPDRVPSRSLVPLWI
jgi:hypothetical protein